MTEKDALDAKESLSAPCLRCLWRTVLFRLTFLVALFILTVRSFVFLFHNLQDETLSSEPFGRYAFQPRMSKNTSESIMLTVPSAQSAHSTSQRFSSHPHLAGSDQDLRDAKAILQVFQEQLLVPSPSSLPIFPAGSPESRQATLGLSSSTNPTAWIDVYYPYLDTPLERSLEILDKDGQSLWDADLSEDGDPLDDHAHKYRNSVLAWHGFSWHGEAQGQLIYANYGTQEDYNELLANGANLTDKIVLVRYGSIYRGLKIKGAQELGAAGVLIYSDPRDDGYVTVKNGFKPYPHGPARNPTSVQRGSSMFLSIYPGDPTTPGYPAYEGADRVEPANIPHIPSLPISWNNAQRLFQELGGEGSDSDIEPLLSGRVSHRTIKMVNHVDGKVKPIWNTMASIPGHIRDEVVVVGCHRDAWVLGGSDPVSGTVSLMEVVRAFATLLRQGWRPLRTILFASWDAEEQGLIGSVEYGEDFASWISEHVVSYINVDSSSSGSQWNIQASPSLAHLIKQTALDVPHPSADGRTLWDARNDDGIFSPNDSLRVDSQFIEAHEEERANRQRSSTGVGRLGSGSDFTVFLQRLGIPSVDQGFGRTPTDAVYHYHSIYDSIRWQEEYGDPDFSHHLAVAQHLGLLALRITDSITLPLNITQYSLELDEYLNDVENIASITNISAATTFSALRKAIGNLQSVSLALDHEKEDAEKKFRELLDRMPKSPLGLGVCKRRGVIYEKIANFVKGIFGVSPSSHHPDFWSVSLANVEAASGDRKSVFPRKEFIRAAKRVRAVNKKLASFERGFISDEGIKDREWYKHLGVAPGKWLGYGATTFPALTEAITIERNNTLATYEAQRLTNLLTKLADQIAPMAGPIRYCRL